MRLDIVSAVFRKELREMLRDRRSLAVMFGLPLVLYPMVALGIASLGANKKHELTEQVARVMMTDTAAAPHLREMMRDKSSGIELVPSETDRDPRELLSQGRIDAVIEVTPDLEKAALEGHAINLDALLDRSRTTADFVERKLRKLIDDYQHWVIEQRLKERGVPASVLTPITLKTDDVANSAQRFGHVLAQALPVLLMMTGMLGALFPALNATTTERELGTLEALLLTPARRFELLAAKGALVLLCGLLTAGLNMLSMSLVLLRSVTLVQGAAANLSISPGMLALSYLAAVPALIFFTAIVMIVGLVARNFREANAFATPVMLIPLASFAVAVMEPKATPALLITPVANTTIVIREVLTGRASAGPFLLAFFSSCLYAGIILSLAGRLFSSEQLVNPAWEPLSFKLLRRGVARRQPRIPAVDEAMVLFCVVLLLLFYISPSFLNHGLLPAAAGNELLLILAPTLAFAAIGNWDWVRTFSLRRPPVKVLIAAALIGIGLSPWSILVVNVQEKFWPSDPQTMARQQEIYTAALRAFPALTIIVTALLAGVCEESLFRGPIQTSLLRKVPPWAAITFAAFLFSAVHFDVHDLAIRAALGALLGWIAWQSGSILPAIIAHCLYDSTQLAIEWWALSNGRVTATPPQSGLGLEKLDFVALAVGAAMLVVAAVLWVRAARQISSPAAIVAATPIRQELLA